MTDTLSPTYSKCTSCGFRVEGATGPFFGGRCENCGTTNSTKLIFRRAK